MSYRKDIMDGYWAQRHRIENELKRCLNTKEEPFDIPDFCMRNGWKVNSHHTDRNTLVLSKPYIVSIELNFNTFDATIKTPSIMGGYSYETREFKQEGQLTQILREYTPFVVQRQEMDYGLPMLYVPHML